MNLLSDITKKINRNKKYFISLIIAFVIGILLGIFFKTETQSLYFNINVLKSYLYILDVEQSIVGNAGRRLVLYCLILLIFLISSQNHFSLSIHFIFIIYQGFILSSITPYFFTEFAFSGAVIYIIGVMPCVLLQTFSLIIFSLLSFDFLLNKKCYKNKKKTALILAILISFTLNIIAFSWQIFFVGIIIRPLTVFF